MRAIWLQVEIPRWRKHGDGKLSHPQVRNVVSLSSDIVGNITTYTPLCTSIKGPMVSTRWYLGCLKGQLGGAGKQALMQDLELVYVALGSRGG